MNKLDPQIDEKIASVIFFPRPDIAFGFEAKGAFDHLFEVEAGIHLRIRAYLGDPSAPVILFFHGNGETARDYDMTADYYRGLPASFLVGEYRGYGPCTGRPSFHTFLQDAHHTLDECRRLLDRRGHTGPLVVMGRSLGSAPAIELASARGPELAGLIIESGFARAIPLLELVGVPASSLGLTEEYGPRNLEKMKKASLPTLIMHAEMDQIIPFEDAELLRDASPDSQKLFFPVPLAGHNDIQIRAGTAYFDQIRDLLSRINRSR
jgi:alpha-beta hydrolase superfamily lysophospholipase